MKEVLIVILKVMVFVFAVVGGTTIALFVIGLVGRKKEQAKHPDKEWWKEMDA